MSCAMPVLQLRFLLMLTVHGCCQQHMSGEACQSAAQHLARALV